jgi:DNA-directed RNA polymerase specialized sigma24 family protein
MPHPTDLQSLTLAGIAHRCTSETNLFFQRRAYDPRYCFELFRRAILHRDPCAWEHVYAQYRPLVAGWVRRHSAFSSTGEEVHYFVNRTFEKMWLAVTPDRFSHFENLKSLLRYLQMCVHSTILDVVRANECQSTTVGLADIPVEMLAVGDGSNDPAVEHTALEQVQRQAFWREIDARLHSEQERRVVYGSFVLALKPRELYAQYPNTFRDVNHVYRVKENVLARLRRDSTLEALLGQDA